MPDEPDQLPVHLTQTAPSDEELWKSLARTFDDLRDLFTTFRLETKAEAVGERLASVEKVKISGKKFNKKPSKAKWTDTAPQWYDESIKMTDRSWLLLPYINAVNQEELQEAVQSGLSRLPLIESKLAARELSVSFMLEWGLFCEAAGALQLVSFSESDVGRAREAASNPPLLNEQRVWFAKYFVRAKKQLGNTQSARDALELLINQIIDGKVTGSESLPAKWFEQFLNLREDRASNPNYGRLTKEFRQNLTIKQLEELAGEPDEGLPPLDLKIPTP